jgi:hypothetical protein
MRRVLFGLALVAVPVPYWVIEGGRVPVVWLVAVASLVVTSAVRQGGSVSAQIAQWLAIQAVAAVVVAYLIARLGAAVMRWVVPVERQRMVVVVLCLVAVVAMCSPIYTSSAVHDGTPTNLLGILALW